MADEILRIDANNKNASGAVTDNAAQEIRNLRIDDATKGLKVMIVGGGGGGTVTSITAGTGLTATPNPIIATGTIALDSKLAPLDTLGTAGQQIRVNAGATALEYFTAGGGSGTVTSVSVTTANGVSGVVANPTTTPAITITLGAITPTSVNGITLSGSGSIANTGVSSLTTFVGSGTSSGTNTGDQTFINATTITNDTTTNATMFPVWVTANSGNLPLKVSSTELTWNPSTGVYSAPILQATTALNVLDHAAPTKVAGQFFISSFTQNGSSRPLLIQNLGATNFVLSRDNTLVVHNASGASIPQGSCVYVTGTTGNTPNIALAQSNAIATLPCIGITADTIANGADGFCMKLGVLFITTTGFTIGDRLWVSPTTPGAFTNVRPSGTTNFVELVGVVLKVGAGGAGQVLVRAVGPLLNSETGTNSAVWNGTVVDVLTGYRVAGGAVSGTILQGNGTNYVPSTFTLPTSAGTSGNVLTSNGTNFVSQAPVAPAVTPVIMAVANFESSGRYTNTITGGGIVNYGSQGVDLQTGAIAGSNTEKWIVFGNTTNLTLESQSPLFSVSFSVGQAAGFGTDFALYVGLGLPTVASAGITFTDNHIGFKITRTASGTASLFATQANGATETASSALTTCASGDIFELILKVNGSSSVDYYWRKNNSALSSATNLATNLGTGLTLVVGAISNKNVSSQTDFNLSSASYSR